MLKNVRDEWQDKTDEEIKSLRTTTPLIVATENTGDFNKSNILRTAEFFGASEFWIVGKKKWDRRGAVGAHNRLTLRYFETWDGALRVMYHDPVTVNHEIVALEQSETSVPINEMTWNVNTILLCGEEGNGLSQDILDICKHHVEIPARGAVRSLNVASAAAIAIYDYTMRAS